MAKPRSSVRALIIRENRLLVTVNSHVTDPYLLLPGGGQEFGESMAEAAARECLEELSVEVRVGDIAYLRDYIGKLENERARLEKLADDPTATPGARTKALKDVGAVVKQIEELTAWERDVVYPLAQEKIAIDLDDGVKRNYPLFGAALRQIKGLEAADD